MSINSRAKGARIEREAAKFLASLGFTCERNARNGKSTADLDLSQDPILSRVHIEVKGDEQMGLTGAFLDKTFAQAQGNANGKPVAILWRKKRAPWVLTWWGTQFSAFHCANADGIKFVLSTL